MIQQFLAMIDKKIKLYEDEFWEYNTRIDPLRELRSDVEKMEEEKDFNVEDIVMRKPEHKTVKYTMTPSHIK